MEEIESGNYQFKVISDQLGSTIYSDELYVQEDTVKNIKEENFDSIIEVTATAPEDSDELESATLGVMDEEGYLIKRTHLNFDDSGEATISLSKGLQQGRDYQLYIGKATRENAYIVEEIVTTNKPAIEMEVKLEEQFTSSESLTASFGTLSFADGYEIETEVSGEGSIELDRLDVLSPYDNPEDDDQIYIGVLRDGTRDDFSEATPGELYIDGEQMGYTIEPPWKNNKNRESAVPADDYEAAIRRNRYTSFSTDVIQLEGKHNRNNVQFHAGQWADHTIGCVLPGKTEPEDTSVIQWDDIESSEEVVENLVDNKLDDPPETYWENKPDHFTEEIKATAIPNTGWGFEQWTGGLSGSSNPEKTEIEEDMTIEAEFDYAGELKLEWEEFSPTVSNNDFEPSITVCIVCGGALGHHNTIDMDPCLNYEDGGCVRVPEPEDTIYKLTKAYYQYNKYSFKQDKESKLLTKELTRPADKVMKKDAAYKKIILLVLQVN